MVCLCLYIHKSKWQNQNQNINASIVRCFFYKKKSNKDKLSPQGAVHRSIFQIMSNQQKLDKAFNILMVLCDIQPSIPFSIMKISVCHIIAKLDKGNRWKHDTFITKVTYSSATRFT